jgi:hypothetical protein
MLYLELRDGQVVTYLDHAANRPDRYSFEDVLAGKHDVEFSQLFGAETPAEVKAAIRLAQNPPPVLTKEQMRELRREEYRDRRKG